MEQVGEVDSVAIREYIPNELEREQIAAGGSLVLALVIETLPRVLAPACRECARRMYWNDELKIYCCAHTDKGEQDVGNQEDEATRI